MNLISQQINLTVISRNKFKLKQRKKIKTQISMDHKIKNHRKH